MQAVDQQCCVRLHEALELLNGPSPTNAFITQLFQAPCSNFGGFVIKRLQEGGEFVSLAMQPSFPVPCSLQHSRF